MKKILIALTVVFSMSAAHAVPAITQMNATRPANNSAYSVGYHHGKSDAYNNTARTLFIVGAVVIAGVVVYHLGQESRWGVSENGLSYKF